MQITELVIAVAPVAMYLVIVGAINLRRQAYIMTGAREAMLVGLALSGLAIVGPMSLFFPQQAANQFGPSIWLLLLTFYLLVVLLWILIARPRLVIYNISAGQLRAVLADVAGKLDGESRWAGDSLCLPKLNVNFYIDDFGAMRNVSLVSTGGDQSFANWRRLERSLRAGLADLTVPRNPRGYTLFTAGTLLLVTLAMQVARDPQAIAQGLVQLLRL